MSIRISQLDHVNIPHETADKVKINNRRYDAFIKSCLDELKSKGETICFNKKHIEQIQEHVTLTEIVYDEGNDCYYLFSQR